MADPILRVAAASTSSGTSASITMPNEAQVGDTVVLIGSGYGSDAGMTPGAGWTQLTSQTTTSPFSATCRHEIWVRNTTVQAGQPGNQSLTINQSESDQINVCVVVIGNADPQDLIDGTFVVVTSPTNGDAVITSGSVTTTQPNSIVVRSVMGWGGGSITGWSVSSGVATELVDTGTWDRFALYADVQSSPGASTTPQFTTANSSGRLQVITFAVKGAASGTHHQVTLTDVLNVADSIQYTPQIYAGPDDEVPVNQEFVRSIQFTDDGGYDTELLTKSWARLTGPQGHGLPSSFNDPLEVTPTVPGSYTFRAQYVYDNPYGGLIFDTDTMELVVVNPVLSETLVDKLGLADEIAKASFLQRVVLDSLGVEDEPVPFELSTTYFESFQSSVAFVDAVSGSIILRRELIDALGLADQVHTTASGAIFVTLTDGLSLRDILSRAHSAVRSLVDPLGTSDTVHPVGMISRTLVDALGVDDSLSRQISLIRQFNEIVTLDDSITFSGVNVTFFLGIFTEVATQYNFLDVAPRPYSFDEGMDRPYSFLNVSGRPHSFLDTTAAREEDVTQLITADYGPITQGEIIQPLWIRWWETLWNETVVPMDIFDMGFEGTAKISRPNLGALSKTFVIPDPANIPSIDARFGNQNPEDLIGYGYIQFEDGDFDDIGAPYGLAVVLTGNGLRLKSTTVWRLFVSDESPAAAVGA